MSDKDTRLNFIYGQFFYTKIIPNKNELVCIRDFEAVEKPRSCVLSAG